MSGKPILGQLCSVRRQVEQVYLASAYCMDAIHNNRRTGASAWPAAPGLRTESRWRAGTLKGGPM